MFLEVLLIALAVSAQATTVSYEGYKVFRVVPQDFRQLQFLQSLKTSERFDFWTESRLLFHPSDIMVEPMLVNVLKHILDANKLEYTEIINNVEKTFEDTTRIVSPRSGDISFLQYNRYATVESYLKNLAAQFPDKVTLLNIGKTTENRDVLGLRISNGNGDKDRPIILVDAGIHAREWLAPATALYIINQLVENKANEDLVANVDWIVIPVLNPDGYEFTHRVDRLWRKTRSQGQRCFGVDANRNFGFHWMETGASDNECSETYAGPKEFSEPETVNLKNFALEHKDNIKLYLTFHSYGQYLLYPWGFTADYPSNREELHNLASEVNHAIRAVRGTQYTIGSSTNVLYPAAGGSDDWMMGIAGVPLTYTIELPSRGSGFQPPNKEIIGVVTETFEGVKVYGKQIEKLWT